MKPLPVGIEKPVRVALVGAQGFVGSAFARHLRARLDVLQLTEITRASYHTQVGHPHDVVIHCAGNSKKFFAEEHPFDEFDSAVGIVVRCLRDFPASLHILVSSVDVYHDVSSPQSTVETATNRTVSHSHYGFHKFIAEEIVRHYAESWLVLRLAGMVGPGLKKNPVFDLLNRHPLRIHPASKYQYMLTDDVARISWTLVCEGVRNETFNICGDGSLRIDEIAQLLSAPMDLSLLEPGAVPRVVDINIEKIKGHLSMPDTRSSLIQFAKELSTNP